jgi:hypothetical protein
MKKSQSMIWLASVVFLTTSLAIPAFAQQASALYPDEMSTLSTAPRGPKYKEKKVWTEDSIANVRTPADKYLDQKEAAEMAAKAFAAKEAATPVSLEGSQRLGAPPIILQIPNSAEETQQAIDQRKSMAGNLHRLLSNAQERLETERDPQVRAALLEMAALLYADINTTNAELSTLENALDNYHHGKIPAQPKPADRASIPDPGKGKP